MEKHIEKEYKLLVSQHDFETLRSFFPDLKGVDQINRYYDNANHDLTRKHIAMRIRTKNNTYLFTLKRHTSEGLQECECYLANDDITQLSSQPVKDLLNSFGISGHFECIASLTTNRAVYLSPDYELCFDINYYNDKVDYEIEYEYRTEHDGLSNFKAILNQANLEYQQNAPAKIKRALQK